VPAARSPIANQAQGPKQAMNLLAKLGVDAIRSMNGSEPTVTKSFVTNISVKHVRIVRHGDKPLPEYMALPLDQYAIYDPRLMRRVADAEGGGDGSVFEVSLPTLRPPEGGLAPRPRVRVQVTPSREQLQIKSLSATLFDGQLDDASVAALPGNMTAAKLRALEGGIGSLAGLGFLTSLSWARARRTRDGQATRLTCRTDVSLRLQLPSPFTRVPRAVVQGAIGVVMRWVAATVLPRFANLLEADYRRWCNGTRDLSTPLGSLMLDEEGFIVYPARREGGRPGEGAALGMAGPGSNASSCLDGLQLG